jgi:hypothetical protein
MYAIICSLLLVAPAQLLAGRMYWERGDGGWALFQGVQGGKTPNDYQRGWLSDDGKYWHLRHNDDKDVWQRDMLPYEPPNGWVGTVITGIVAIGGETTGVILKTINGTYELKFKDNAEAKKFDGKMVRIKGGLSTWTGTERTRFVIWVKEIKVE